MVEIVESVQPYSPVNSYDDVKDYCCSVYTDIGPISYVKFERST